MTTIIYKKTDKGSEIVADKRSTGGYSMLVNNEYKLVRYKNIVLGLAGNSIDKDLLDYIVIKFLKDLDLTNYLSPLLVKDLYNEIIKESGIKDSDTNMLIVIGDKCYTVLSGGYIEKHDNFVSIGSGSSLAEGINLGNNDLDIGEFIPLISTKDGNTSFEFDYQLIK